jgi:hypothetical protein
LATPVIQGLYPQARTPIGIEAAAARGRLLGMPGVSMKLFNPRKVLALGGLLIVTLAAGCAGGQGGAPYGYNTGYGSAYPYNGGAYVAPYPYNGGYRPVYPYAGVYPNPSYYNHYQQNRLSYNENYEKNLQIYDRQHPNNQVHPYNQQNAYNHQAPYNQQHSYNQQHAHNQPSNQQHQEHQEHQ